VSAPKSRSSRSPLTRAADRYPIQTFESSAAWERWLGEHHDTASQNRYAILFRIQTAKKPETRARRIEKFIGMLNEGQKLHP